MAQWLVMQGDNKFPVASLADLEAMARRGRLKAADMIQPPGTTEWLYVTDVPELKALVESNSSYDDDDDEVSSNRGMFGGMALAATAGVLAIVFAGVILVGGGTMLYFANQMQNTGGGLIGEGGLTYSEMIVTAEGSGLRSDPREDARIVTSVSKDSTLELLAKRGNFYRAREKSGSEGWILTSHVIPMYQLGGAEVRQEYDPLYNPDQYVDVSNARWMQLPAEKPGPMQLTNVTAFEFMMSNSSKYPMTELRILATIKDAQGHELEKVEIPVEGVIPADGATFIGTLSSETEAEKSRKKPKDPNAPPDRIMTTHTFEQLAAEDPDLQLRWTSGVEVEMKTEAFASAQIDIVELRAIPDAEAATVVTKE
jgi:hypothetical protein